jgi:hypothetical protein
VVIYKVTEPDEEYGPLNEFIVTVQADTKGHFGLTLEGLKGSERMSAIAIHSNYGASEPALTAKVRSLN